MTPIADFRKLVKGILEFPPELNGSNRKPHPLDTIIRWADANTWARAATHSRVQLWQAIALHLHLEPESLNWQKLTGVAAREFSAADRTVATLFANRMTLALQHTATGNLPTVPGARPEECLVALSDFAEWAQVYTIPLPSQFPRSGGVDARHEAGPPPAVPVVRQPTPAAAPHQTPQAAEADPPTVPVTKTVKRRRSGTPAEYIRAAELLERVLPFSSATLWRRVKDGAFPAPTKLSTKVTAWRRAEVDEWLAAQGIRKKTARQPGKKRSP